MRSATASGGRALALLGAFISVSVVVGLLLAGLALPTAWATGTATRGGIDFFNSLPDELAEPPLAEQSAVLDAGGRPIAYMYDERRILVPLAKISPTMQHAIVAIEDSRFFNHGGIDLKGLVRAFVTNQVNDGNVQGASTLTQQYIKLRIYEAAQQDTAAQNAALRKDYKRKLEEIRMAIALEKKKTKPDILEGYLNIANFGDSTYGVEAAAEYFFDGTTAAKLTLPQAALLAGLVQSPQRYNPFLNRELAKNRRDTVLGRMHDLGMIDDKQFKDAVASDLGVKKRRPHEGCISSQYAYFCSYVRNLLIKGGTFKSLGSTEEERSSLLDRGGLIIRTTINSGIQETAQRTVDEKVPRDNPTQVGSAAVTVEPGTGKVLAMVQNRTYDNTPKIGNTVINYAVDQNLGSGSGFQTGSTFKPFVLATWLSKGKGLYDSVDASITRRPMEDFQGCKGTLHGPSFPVHNSADGEGSGSMTVIDATTHSVNLAYMDMASKLSLCDIKAMAEKLGAHRAMPKEECSLSGSQLPDCIPSMVLGSVEQAPLTMATAYAAFAADGTYCTPVVVTSITDRDGKALPVPSTQCSQALEPNIAHGVTYALKTVLTSGTAAGQGIGRPAAGKTGTSDDSVDTWFVGYTPQRSTAVWVGDNPNPTQQDGRSGLGGRTLGGHHYGSVFGATIAAPIWGAIMKKANDGLPAKDWPAPTGKVMTGSSVKLPDVHGMPVDAAVAALTEKGFQVSVGDPVDSDLQPDQVESTSPPAGSRVAPKSKIVIHPGNGQGGGQGQPGPDGKPGQPNQPGQPGQPGQGVATRLPVRPGNGIVPLPTVIRKPKP